MAAEYLSEHAVKPYAVHRETGEALHVVSVSTDEWPIRPQPKPIPKPRRPRKSLKRMKRVKKLGQKDVPRLRRKLWSLFSRYVRNRDGGVCFTCPEPNQNGNQAGHFYSRRIPSICYDPKNVHAQCSYCNEYLHGAPGAYSQNIVERYGKAELTRIRNRARTQHKWTAPDLQELIVALEKSGADYELAYYGKYL